MDDASFFSGLVPELASLARAHRANCRANGLAIRFESGRRSFADQIAEYTKGRARTDHGWIVLDRALIVTRALPEEDPHCIGAAYDIAVLNEYGLRDWARIDLFKAALVYAPKMLINGGHWAGLKDWGHYELPKPWGPDQGTGES